MLPNRRIEVTMNDRQPYNGVSRLIERHLLPAKKNDKNKPEYLSSVQALQRRPMLALMFIAPGMYWGRDEGHNLEREILESYEAEFLHGIIAIGCNESLDSESTILSCDGPRGPANGVLSLFFNGAPTEMKTYISFDKADERTFTTCKFRYLNPPLGTFSVNNLRFQDGGHTAAVLIFANSLPSNLHAISNLLAGIRNWFKQKEFPIWGGYTNDDICILSKPFSVGTYVNSHYTVVRFESTRIKCWTTIFKCNDEKATIDAKLVRFRSKTLMRTFNLLLIAGPAVSKLTEEEKKSGKYYVNCVEFRDRIKMFFKDVPIVGTFYNGYYCIGSDFLVRDQNQKFVHDNCISLLILAYD